MPIALSLTDCERLAFDSNQIVRANSVHTHLHTPVSAIFLQNAPS